MDDSRRLPTKCRGLTDITRTSRAHNKNAPFDRWKWMCISDRKEAIAIECMTNISSHSVPKRVHTNNRAGSRRRAAGQVARGWVAGS